MKTTTIDMRPEPFELPFFYEQLDILEKNRLALWQDGRRVLGKDNLFAYCDSAMVRQADGMGPVSDGELYALAGYPSMTKRLDDALRHARDFIMFHERNADEHGGLRLDDCHEWGNAKCYDGGRFQPRSLQYGVRLSFNDGTVRFFTITSKLKSEL